MDFKKRLSGHYKTTTIKPLKKKIDVLRFSDLKIKRKTVWQSFVDFFKNKSS